MLDALSQIVSVMPARAGWSAMVDSMQAAIEDRSHLVGLGVAAGIIVMVYANYRVARWLERKSEHHE